MAVCLELVRNVLAGGRVSNDGKQHCYCSSFNVYDRKYMVTTDLNKKSERFVIQNIK